MTLATSKRLARFVGDGATTVFPYDFLIPDAASVNVYLYDKTTTERTELAPSTFSVDGLGEIVGGNVTYPLTGSPLTNNNEILIVREVDYLQTLSIINQAGFFPETIEAQLDRIVMQTSQLGETVKRGIFALEGDIITRQLPSKTERANKALTFGADGEPQATPIDGLFGGFDQPLNTTDAPLFGGLTVTNNFKASMPLTNDPNVGTIKTTIGENFVDGAGRGIPTVRGPIRFEQDMLLHGGAYTVQIVKATGDNQALTPTTALYLSSTGNLNYAGAVRGATIQTFVDADAATGVRSIALAVDSDVSAQQGAGNVNIGLDIHTWSRDVNVSTLSGTPTTIEADVAAYLDDDFNSGKGGRGVFKAGCINLDIANVIGPAFFAYGLRIINGPPAASGICWFKRGAHIEGRATNGGMEIGLEVDNTKDRGVSILRAAEYALYIEANASGYSAQKANYGVYVKGDPRTSAIRVEGTAAAALLEIGRETFTPTATLAEIKSKGHNSSGAWVDFSQIRFEALSATAGAQSGRILFRPMISALATTKLTVSDKVIVSAILETPQMHEEGEITIADNAVATVPLDEGGVLIMLVELATTYGAIGVHVRPSTSIVREVFASSGYAAHTLLDATTLTGTTGIDGELTLSANNNLFYIENRTAASRTFSVVKLGRRL